MIRLATSSAACDGRRSLFAPSLVERRQRGVAFWGPKSPMRVGAGPHCCRPLCCRCAAIRLVSAAPHGTVAREDERGHRSLPAGGTRSDPVKLAGGPHSMARKLVQVLVVRRSCARRGLVKKVPTSAPGRCPAERSVENAEPRPSMLIDVGILRDIPKYCNGRRESQRKLAATDRADWRRPESELTMGSLVESEPCISRAGSCLGYSSRSSIGGSFQFQHRRADAHLGRRDGSPWRTSARRTIRPI